MIYKIRARSAVVIFRNDSSQLTAQTIRLFDKTDNAIKLSVYRTVEYFGHITSLVPMAKKMFTPNRFFSLSDLCANVSVVFQEENHSKAIEFDVNAGKTFGKYIRTRKHTEK